MRLLALLACMLSCTAHARNPRGFASGSVFIGSCPVTSGTITLSASTPRSTGISPLLVFYDATATTDSAALGGANNAFQDVTYSWTFGDAGASGTGKWAYGSNPNNNSKNTATGAIAAHLYLTSGADQPYTATVTATDGTSTAQCTVAVTAYDPAGASGFPGTATTCVAQLTLPVAGAGGCPAGAAVLTQANFATAFGSALGNNKRVLFKCGDTFTGDNATISPVKASIGAYGGCEGTQTSQPIFSDTSTNCQMEIGANAGDLRISDIYFNGTTTAKCAVETTAFVTQNIPYQVTLWNLQSTGNSSNYTSSQGAQWGIIGSTTLDARGISGYFNTEAQNPTKWIGTFPNLNYQALLGSSINGVGSGTGAGIEAFRTSACRLCVFENNTIKNANSVGGVFKLHDGNTYQSCGGGQPGISGCWPVGTSGGVGSPCAAPPFANTTCWTGIYTELIEISDNLFTGNSGGILSDITPQNGLDDERIRNVIIERNVYNSPTNACCDTLLFVTGANMTVRDNAFYMPANGAIYPVAGIIVAQRGSGGVATVQYNEVYNNSFFAPNTKGSPGVKDSGQLGVSFDSSGGGVTATANSFAKNNLFYVPTTATGPAVRDTGVGNTVSNNTVTVTSNPAFTNGGASYLLISDFKPTAFYSGGASVPVIYDALNIAWSPTWDLGAVHH